MMSDDPGFAERVNQEMDELHQHLVPVRVVLTTRAPSIKGSIPAERIVTDASGRKTAMAHLCDPALAARLVIMHHQQATQFSRGGMTIDMARQSVEMDVEWAIGRLNAGHIHVTMRNLNHADARQTQFRVDLNLLDHTLQSVPSVLVLSSVRQKNDELAKAVANQCRRLEMLGNEDRLDRLGCCPVLAKQLAGDNNPGQKASMIKLALTSQSHNAAFIEGVLHDRTRLDQGPEKTGTWWEKNILSLYEQLPDTVLTALEGRHLGDLITHSWLPQNARITKAVRLGRRVRITTDAAPVPFMPVYLDTLNRGAQTTHCSGIEMSQTQEDCRATLRQFEARELRIKRGST